MSIMLTADRMRAEAIAQTVYNVVFGLLDAEHDIPGHDAGEIATKAEKVVKDALTELWGVED